MKVQSIAECSLGAFCNTFDLHLGILGLENQFLVFLRVAVLHRFFSVFTWKIIGASIFRSDRLKNIFFYVKPTEFLSMPIKIQRGRNIDQSENI